MRTCHNCQTKDVTAQRRRVEFGGLGYVDILCVACWLDAQRAYAFTVANAVTVGRTR